MMIIFFLSRGKRQFFVSSTTFIVCVNPTYYPKIHRLFRSQHPISLHINHLHDPFNNLSELISPVSLCSFASRRADFDPAKRPVLVWKRAEASRFGSIGAMKMRNKRAKLLRKDTMRGFPTLVGVKYIMAWNPEDTSGFRVVVKLPFDNVNYVPLRLSGECQRYHYQHAKNNWQVSPKERV